jgi:predicted 3-demethylubiquinone-9 3-methyltransferase (glyoxalase superfamily)
VLPEMLKDQDSPQAQRAMEAMLRMKKIDIHELEHAFAG